MKIIRSRKGELERLREERDELAQGLLTPDVFMGLVEWLREPIPRRAVKAFAPGIERQIACALEDRVLPEISRLRQRARLDSERIAQLEADLVQARVDIECWLTDNAGKIETIETELAEAKAMLAAATKTGDEK